MASAADDLAPLLADRAPVAVRLKKGIVRSWDVATGHNTVEVDGVQLTDLPIQNTTEAATLTEGDVVNIMIDGGAWWILGRVIEPGAPGAGGALAIGRTTAAVKTDFAEIDGNSWDYLDGPEVTAIVGASGSVLVTLSCEMTYQQLNADEIKRGGVMGVDMFGANEQFATTFTSLLFADQWGFLNDFQGGVNNGQTIKPTMTCIRRGSYVHLYTGLNPGETLFRTVYTSVYAGNPVTFQGRTLIVQPI